MRVPIRIDALDFCAFCEVHFDARAKKRFGEFISAVYDALAEQTPDSVPDEVFGRMQAAIWKAAAPFVIR